MKTSFYGHGDDSFGKEPQETNAQSINKHSTALLEADAAKR
jgi:hypothetical protein